jgi:hypothetical protein
MYYGTTASPPAEAVYSGTSTGADISSFESGTTYYVWVRAENERGLSPFSKAASITPHLPEPGEPVLTTEPGEPVLTAGDGAITVTWVPVELAISYNVYYGENETRPEHLWVAGIAETSTVITGLSNDTAYYVWVESVNPGEASMSVAKSMTLTLPEPENLELTAGDGEITVTWTPVARASSYNVYYSVNETRPETPQKRGVTETFVVITGNRTYYVWVESVNAGGTSMSVSVSGMPSLVWEVGSDTAFSQAVSEINALSVSGGYLIILTGDIGASNITFVDKGVEKTITIRGKGKLRTIANNKENRLFTVNANNTLLLDNDIKLDGDKREYNAVYIDGGAFVMKPGSFVNDAKESAIYVLNGTFRMEGGEISGNTVSSSSDSYGGGVYVDSGTFTMSGGEISGNTVSSSSSHGGGVYVSVGTFTMSGGEISGNTVSSSYNSYGGGVRSSGEFTMSGGKISGNTVSSSSSSGSSSGGGGVCSSGEFTMSGGEISGNTVSSSYSSSGGGVCVHRLGTFIKSGGGTIDATNKAYQGKVAYRDGDNPKQRNTAAGPTVNMDSGISGSAGGWE